MRRIKQILALFVMFCCVLALFGAPSTAAAAPTMDRLMVASNGIYCAYIKEDNSLWIIFRASESDLDALEVLETEELQVGTRKQAAEKVAEDVHSVIISSLGSLVYLKLDGSLWAVGHNTPYGMLGNGTMAPITQVSKIADNVRSFSIYSEHMLVVKNDNTLWACGSHFNGRLGLGDVATATPNLTKVMDNVASASAGHDVSAAVGTDGSLYLWGYKDYIPGQAEADVLTPLKVMDGVSAVWAARHVLALKTDGSLWGWGGANYKIGTGTVGGDVIDPYKVMDNVVRASAYSSNSSAIKADGSLWTWGANYNGQIGNGTHIAQSQDIEVETATPQQVGPANVIQCVITEDRSIAMTTDGAVWLWGGRDNIYTPFQLTDGKVTAAPAVIAPLTVTARPTASTVVVDGQQVAFEAYNIEGSNYFKLRDLAYTLSGSAKQFNVSYSITEDAVTLISGEAYHISGGEMESKGSGDKTATATNNRIFLDYQETTFNAYNIGGNNYFKLRDIGKAFDFNVSWDGAKNTIIINTNESYSAD